MNKIYKVVWSKVKNCYVVVSEIAKNVITGSIKSAKVGTAPMARGLALGAAMAFVITGNVWAADDSNNNVVVGTSLNGVVYGGNSVDGSANYNIVTIDGITVTGPVVDEKPTTAVAGGHAYVDAIGNKVYVGGGAEIFGHVKGGRAQDSIEDYLVGVAKGNKVEITGISTVHGSVYGAEHFGSGYENGNVYGNEVLIKDSTVDLDVSGGLSHWGGYSILGSSHAIENKVTVESSELKAWVSGGHASFSDAIDNELIIDNSTIHSNAYGGRAQANGSAKGNTVEITDSDVYGHVYGGTAVDSWEEYRTVELVEANGNTVKLENTDVSGIIYGGFSSDEKSFANENTVSIFNATIKNEVYGGSAANEANKNIVTITDSTSDAGRIRSGYSEEGVADGNILIVTGSTFTGSTVGVQAGYGDAGASNNELYISDSTVTSAIWGGSAGGSVGGNADGNKVVLTDTVVNYVAGSGRYVYGGYSQTGSSNYNEVVVNNTVVESIIMGGLAQVNSGGDAIGNKVIINSGETKSNINPGQADTGVAQGNELIINDGNISTNAGTNVKGGYSAKGDAIENVVTINGGTVNNYVYAGYGAGVVKDNVINIGGTANVENANLMGSQKTTDSTGNTLNIGDGWSGTVGSAANFNAINITDGASVKFAKALNAQNATVNVDDATWSVSVKGNKVGTLAGENGVIEIDSSLLGQTGVVTIGTKESNGTVLKTNIKGLDLSNGAKKALEAANASITDNVKDNLNKAVTVTTNNGDAFSYAINAQLSALYGDVDLVDGKVVTEMDTDVLISREDVKAGNISLVDTAQGVKDNASAIATKADAAAVEALNKKTEQISVTDYETKINVAEKGLEIIGKDGGSLNVYSVKDGKTMVYAVASDGKTNTMQLDVETGNMMLKGGLNVATQVQTGSVKIGDEVLEGQDIAQIGLNAEAIEQAQKDITANAGAIEQVQSSMNDITTELGNKANVADVNSAIANVEKGYQDADAAIKTDVKANTKAIEGLGDRVDKHDEAISGLNQRLGKMNGKINKVGAGAAALAALHPLEYDPDDKLTFSAGVGNYNGENAAALGAFYRPDEKLMFSLGGTMGNGENMVNLGVSIGLDGAKGAPKLSRKELVEKVSTMEAENQAIKAENENIKAEVAELKALVAKLVSKK